jgi:hypothetical protein
MMRILINPENTCYFEADADEKNNIKISQTKTSDRRKIKSRKHLYLHEFCLKQCLTFGFESAELSSPAGSVRCGLGFDNGDSLRSKSQW